MLHEVSGRQWPDLKERFARLRESVLVMRRSEPNRTWSSRAATTLVNDSNYDRPETSGRVPHSSGEGALISPPPTELSSSSYPTTATRMSRWRTPVRGGATADRPSEAHGGLGGGDGWYRCRTGCSVCSPGAGVASGSGTFSSTSVVEINLGWGERHTRVLRTAATVAARGRYQRSINGISL